MFGLVGRMSMGNAGGIKKVTGNDEYTKLYRHNHMRKLLNHARRFSF
jgi:hypothetical protein